MKKKLLALTASVFCYCATFAQAPPPITGELNPCPSVDYIYEVVMGIGETAPYPSNAFHCPLPITLPSIPSGTTVRHRFQVKWENFYEVSNGSPVKAYFELSFPQPGGALPKTGKRDVTVKGLADVQFTQTYQPVCAERGNFTFSVNTNPNATKYVWTNTAGWGTSPSETSNPSLQYNVNNANSGSLTVTVYNANCANISKTGTTALNRAPVTVTPTFTSATTTTLCPTATGTAVITGAAYTPVSYLWYTDPKDYVTINNAAYGPSNPLTTAATVTSVSLKYNQTAPGDAQPIVLKAVAVYEGANCQSPVAGIQVVAGPPASDEFRIASSTQGESIGKTKSVCPNDISYLYPINNYPPDRVIQHQWEVVEGDYSSLTSLTGAQMRVRLYNDAGSFLKLRYRYNTTSCGWSNWNNVTMYMTDCGARVGATAVDTPVVSKSAFTVSPNPASSVVTVNMPATVKQTGNFVVNIYNMKGELLSSRKQAAISRFTVDVSKLSAGTYLLEVNSAGRKQAKQIVIAK